MMVNCIYSPQVYWPVTNKEQKVCSNKGKDAAVSFHIFCAFNICFYCEWAECSLLKL